MTLATMREHGVRSVEAACEACERSGIVSVEGWPDDLAGAGRRAAAPVPAVPGATDDGSELAGVRVCGPRAVKGGTYRLGRCL